MSALESLLVTTALEAAKQLAPEALAGLIAWIKSESDDEPAALAELPVTLKTAIGHERMVARAAKSG